MNFQKSSEEGSKVSLKSANYETQHFLCLSVNCKRFSNLDADQGRQEHKCILNYKIYLKVKTRRPGGRYMYLHFAFLHFEVVFGPKEKLRNGVRRSLARVYCAGQQRRCVEHCCTVPSADADCCRCC